VPARRYTIDDLRAALADDEVRTMADLCRALGLVPRGANYETLRSLARRSGIDLSDHLAPPAHRPWHDVPDYALIAALGFATTLADAIRAFGREPSSATYAHVRRVIERHGVDISHMDGRAWARRRHRVGQRIALHELLVADRPTGSLALKERLVHAGFLDERCAACDRTTWEGGPIPLELDHVNGDRRDNRLENLRLLCPNCHALTPTYRGRNIGRGR
jgi:hypothetical protein